MNKRIVKSPKLYFYDTGLLCHLLGIKSVTALKKNNAYCALFENRVMSEIRKNNFNAARNEGMYYFRDSTGNEVDIISERDGELVAIEIKAGVKTNNNNLRGLKYWQKYQLKSQSILVYGGKSIGAKNERLSIVPWTEVANF